MDQLIALPIITMDNEVAFMLGDTGGAAIVSANEVIEGLIALEQKVQMVRSTSGYFTEEDMMLLALARAIVQRTIQAAL